jgi:hypothetical protein
MKKPLVVYEGLRLDYPWASERHHRFVLEYVSGLPTIRPLEVRTG